MQNAEISIMLLQEHTFFMPYFSILIMKVFGFDASIHHMTREIKKWTNAPMTDVL